MRSYYKFLHKADVSKCIEDETIIVSSSGFFRNHPDPFIGDPDEGVFRSHIINDSMELKTIQDLRRLSHFGVMFDHKEEMERRISRKEVIPKLTISATNTTNVIKSDFYIYSLAFGDVSEIWSAFLSKCDPQYRYDAAIMITDINSYLTHIHNFAVHAKSRMPIKLMFPRVDCALVDYSKKTVASFSEMDIDYSRGTYKGSKYSWQSEFRLILLRQTYWGEDRIVFHVPGIRRYLREVSVPSCDTA